MKRSIVICVTALSLGLVLWKVPGHRIDSAREHNDRVIPLSHGTLLRQSFPVYHNGLYEVELGNLVNKAITRPDTDQELFAFTLFDSRHTALRTVQFSSRNVGDGSPLTLVFPPLAGSAGNIYTMELQSLESTISAKPVIGVSAARTGNTIYFRTYYKNKLGIIFGDSLKAAGGRFVSDRGFAVPYIILFLVLCAALIF